MLTPFGKALRMIRVDKSLRLLDLAEKIKRSAAFISAVETGRKPIPDGFVVELSRALDLTALEIKSLRKGADQTRKEVRVDKLPAEDRELVAAFARRLDETTEHQKLKLKRWILKSSDDEIPFRRKRSGIVVPPLSLAKIRELAEKFRAHFGGEEVPSFPIVEILEFGMPEVIQGFYLDIRSCWEMGNLEGMVVSGENRMTLREDVYEKACNENGRARFTAAHELGHFLMHRNISLARISDNNTKPYEDSEWQADAFAASLLVSNRHLARFGTAEELAYACNISRTAARVIWSKYQSTRFLESR